MREPGPICPECDSTHTVEPKVGKGIYECQKCFHEFTKAQAGKPAPGMEDAEGEHYEPEAEPNMEEFAVNKAGGGYKSPHTNHETGFITADGHGIQMGHGGTRYEDHRKIIPTSEAMRRWGWPAEIIKGVEEGTRTPAMYETMRRAGLVRIHSDPGTLILSLVSRLTPEQRKAIIRHVERHRPAHLVISPTGKDEMELDGAEAVYDMEKYLKRATAGLPMPKVKLARVTGQPFPGLLKAIYHNPEDSLGYLVLADHLEEQGHDHEAHAIREAMQENKVPEGVTTFAGPLAGIKHHGVHLRHGGIHLVSPEHYVHVPHKGAPVAHGGVMDHTVTHGISHVTGQHPFNRINHRELSDMVEAYAQAALWSSSGGDSGDEPLDGYTTHTHTLPERWASYLINGDSSGDEHVPHEVREHFEGRVPNIVDVSGEGHFGHFHGVGDTLAEYTEAREPYHIYSIHPESAVQMIRDCLAFYRKHRHTMAAQGHDPAEVGHNLWLTKEHHGAGFWDDHRYPQEYTDDARKLGENGIYEGGDGHLYHERQPKGPVRLARMKAPAGGAVVNNSYGKGGQFLASPLQPVRGVCRKLRAKYIKQTPEMPPIVSPVQLARVSTSEFPGLVAAIHANPHDSLGYLVLADHLEEQGHDREAHAIRFILRDGVVPEGTNVGTLDPEETEARRIPTYRHEGDGLREMKPEYREGTHAHVYPRGVHIVSSPYSIRLIHLDPTDSLLAEYHANKINGTMSFAEAKRHGMGDKWVARHAALSKLAYHLKTFGDAEKGIRLERLLKKRGRHFTATGEWMHQRDNPSDKGRLIHHGTERALVSQSQPSRSAPVRL